MRIVVALVVLGVWSALALVGWWALRDIPFLEAREPAPSLTGVSHLYLDRDYRLDVFPGDLDGAVVVRTFRHGQEPVHLLLDAPATVYLLAAEGTRPQTWSAWKTCAFNVRSDGAAADLVQAFERNLPAGKHTIDVHGPGNVTSPVLVVSNGPVREIETPAGLLRRAEVATRRFPRRTLLLVIGIAGLIGALAAALLTPRRVPSES